jgi:hypothetical protein
VGLASVELSGFVQVTVKGIGVPPAVSDRLDGLAVIALPSNTVMASVPVCPL